MKSDEAYIAGIYEKAEKLRAQETKDIKIHHFHVWQGVAAAACLCLMVFGAVRMGQTKAPADENNPENRIKTRQTDMQGGEVTINNRIMPYSEGEISVQEASGRGSSADLVKTVEGRVCEFIPAEDTDVSKNHPASACAQLILQIEQPYIDESVGWKEQIQIAVTGGEVFEPGEQVTVTIAWKEAEWQLVDVNNSRKEQE